MEWKPELFGYIQGHKDADLTFDAHDSAPYAPLGMVMDEGFDWGDDKAPQTPWYRTAVYELHVKGFTKLHEGLPPHLRGTYAGLSSDEAMNYFKKLGVTAIERDPVTATLAAANLGASARVIVGDVADHQRGGLPADLGGQLRRLGDRPERVLVEVALVVVQGVDQDASHYRSFLSSSQATIFSTVSLVSSSSMISPDCLAGGGLMARTLVFEPSSPTSPESIPTSSAPWVSRGFFFAPMIAFSDG